jgi:hypothetical protein
MNMKFFDVEQQHRLEAATVEELDDDDNWSGPDLDE